MNRESKIQPRRTFAIISHPDAGKTTLTEKLLLMGGMIRSAGTVKGKKSGKFATSDWMEIEKQRGISVTSSVLQFSYKEININIVDTPGHQDFSEDTYRTLQAVDSAVMVIDCTKGIEAQTLKLFKVCKMRGIPILTFINKLDREGKEPLALLEEIEKELGIETFPMNWPVGMGKRFQGIYDRTEDRIELYKKKDDISGRDLQGLEENDKLESLLGEDLLSTLSEEIELLAEAGNTFSEEKIETGEQTPVFFGSAITSFGVQSFLDSFVELALPPQPRKSTAGDIQPSSATFSGFIFKIQANMNPAHRDRIAFMRICSGKFERGMTVTLARTEKAMKLAQPHQFLATDRETVDEAFPGDIIGLFDPGVFKIGDTLVQDKPYFQFERLPQFPPEFFAKVTPKHAMKHKHFYKGVSELVQEGAVQLYKTPYFEDYILGAVGELQFQVFEYRMKAEYNVDVEFQHLKHGIAQWLDGGELTDNMLDSRVMLVKDQQQRDVLLFENEFTLNLFKQKYPKIDLKNPFDII
jgi:peptide chain release factor 3